ncbi:type II toxin-antitoxin system VapC family toxin [Bradyrhizobium sp. AUGA SZCCT0240]|jgi:tRNA(fMet)-specific endonuclease VapC|uniref:type II toxin-antitoxin system VapC family toxin n=1 Tax=unclassified Bradyrhizobium TaxID=2631580 RepID=UPI001BA853ED|nr:MULTISPECIES: type II toxin-antitoxin system VapC family toxin [unclassified Bradyrhizobium]MBR1200930.1 type II toxin-antitoxin system VapC family toxin [Bradyrhizobium sp. AUGA SZCCT0158]MBR1244981.1 type II toxin-antitoxin system VapC family toxin [Bradyrhizobium sp. AUGA SZCCT0274]MBR1251223.1 type II toxin-antitoxin system VapC family toxin [Bradyrhizobium sp. AUGA SZCCT0169]MBR1258792.1 type II toxin-antitoxin system VapC family toxin [Bradyrhizobium sp. AUGA SZCCT0240]
MICLDTNIVIGIVSGRNSSFRHRVGEQMRGGTPIGLPVIALFEMRYGFAKSDRREHNEYLLERFLGLGIDLLPFEPEDAMHAGDIRADLEKAGTPIGHYDILIAAQARRHGATLVTANAREFARVPGLLVANWEA